MTIDESWLQQVAASIKLPPLNPQVTRNLLPIIEIHIRQLLQQSYKYTLRSHSKVLTVEDFNCALFSNKIEPVYGLSSNSSSDQLLGRGIKDNLNSPVNLTTGVIDLNELASTPLPPIPLKPQFHMHWLVVDGEQPMIAENPTISGKLQSDDTSDNAIALPKEMQVYFLVHRNTI